MEICQFSPIRSRGLCFGLLKSAETASGTFCADRLDNAASRCALGVTRSVPGWVAHERVSCHTGCTTCHRPSVDGDVIDINALFWSRMALWRDFGAVHSVPAGGTPCTGAENGAAISMGCLGGTPCAANKRSRYKLYRRRYKLYRACFAHCCHSVA